MMRKTLAILGAGKMGCDIAALFAANGWITHVFEPAAGARDTLPQRVKFALKPLRAARGAYKCVHPHESLGDLPWKNITLVIEAAPEKLALKQNLFAQIETLSRADAILTTNTSSLRLADITKRVKNKSRVAGVHFLTPANISPLVEIVRGKETDAKNLRRIDTWMKSLGKSTVKLNRDIPGMIVNRVQGAMMREIFQLIDEGIASAEDIDTAVRYGFGFRYIACGPVRQRDFNGLEIHRDAAAQIYPTLHNGKKPARCLEALVRDGHIGVRTGRGFYRWKKDELKQLVTEYERTMVAALKLMTRNT